MAKSETPDGASLPYYIKSRIKQGIQDGRFEPGSRLRETEICDWLKVSRTPVREAVAGLISEGFLVSLPSRGTAVNQLDRQQVREFYAVRGSLEALAARLASQFMTEDDIDYLEQLTAKSEQTTGNPQKQEQLNKTFHESILNASHNRYLSSALNSFEWTIALLKGTTYSLPGRPDEAHRQHRAMIAALRQRDPEAAAKASLEHSRSSEQARLRMLFDPI